MCIMKEMFFILTMRLIIIVVKDIPRGHSEIASQYFLWPYENEMLKWEILKLKNLFKF
jgi:hypothetical protein